MVNENCHYYKHAPKTPSPKNLSLEDFEDIMASDRIFARKFIMDSDIDLMNKIDQTIDEQLMLGIKVPQ